jgi:type IV pilus assembly protein PilM
MSMLASLKNLADMEFLSMFSPQRQLLGLDIGSSSIKLVQIKEHRGRYTLQKFAVKELEPEVIVDGTVMDEGRVVSAIKELLAEQNIKLKQVAISISGHAVIVKKISLPPMPDEELDAQVKLSAEQYIPFDINEVNLDFHVLPPSENPDEQSEMSIVLVAAKKDKINELTELVKAAGLSPVVMDVDAFAVENMYGVTSPATQDDTTILVNIGASVMNVNIVGGGSLPLYSRYSPGREPVFRGRAAGDGGLVRRSGATQEKRPRRRSYTSRGHGECECRSGVGDRPHDRLLQDDLFGERNCAGLAVRRGS